MSGHHPNKRLHRKYFHRKCQLILSKGKCLNLCSSTFHTSDSSTWSRERHQPHSWTSHAAGLMEKESAHANQGFWRLSGYDADILVKSCCGGAPGSCNTVKMLAYSPWWQTLIMSLSYFAADSSFGFRTELCVITSAMQRLSLSFPPMSGGSLGSCLQS